MLITTFYFYKNPKKKKKKKKKKNEVNNMNNIVMFINIVTFINKMKFVFNHLPDDEIDTYSDIYNGPTEDFVAWIIRKYDEYAGYCESN